MRDTGRERPSIQTGRFMKVIGWKMNSQTRTGWRENTEQLQAHSTMDSNMDLAVNEVTETSSLAVIDLVKSTEIARTFTKPTTLEIRFIIMSMTME